MTRTPKNRAKPRGVNEGRSEVERVNPAFYVLRQIAIHAAAKAGVATIAIAKALGIDRSYVIRQRTLMLKPRTPAERRILKLAGEHLPVIRRAGLGGLLGGADIETTLAGGERPKLGPLAERRAKRVEEKGAKKAKAAPKAKKAEPKAKAPAKAAPKPPAKKVTPKVKLPPQPKVKSEKPVAPVPEVRSPKPSKPKAAPKAPPKAEAQPELPVDPSAAPPSPDTPLAPAGAPAKPDPKAMIDDILKDLV